MMSETTCLLCKSVQGTCKYALIADVYTKYSNSLFSAFLKRTFEAFQIVQDSSLCQSCVELINELEYAEITYKNLLERVRDRLGCKGPSKANAYSQTDVFLENLLDLNAPDTKNFKIEVLPGEFDTPLKMENEDYIPKTKLLKSHECPVCFKKFASKNGTIMHLKRQHSDFHCEIVQSNNQESVGESGRTKSKDRDELKPYQCTSCSKTWKTMGQLKSHLSAHSDARPFICEVCGQSYKHKSALDVHVGMHNGIYPFTCMHCKKTFTQKGALQRHLPIHTGDTPYQCDLCGKRFIHHTSFNIHQLSHSGEKAYKCVQCGLGFLSGSHLKRHTRVHTGEKNYACSFCGKRFAERYNLVLHQKLHENPAATATFKRNHRCQTCGMTFNRRLKLEEHMAKSHLKVTGSDVSYLQQLFFKSGEGDWSSNYGLKSNMPETSH